MVGGTFDPLHDGHKRLLDRSFEVAGPDGQVVIGLTTDIFINRKTHPIRPFSARKISLEKYLASRPYTTPRVIEPLNDRYGTAIDADFDAIIVSEETLPGAVEINKIRREKGRKKVDIHQISCVLAEDGRWISSTRIYRGEIDAHGRLLH
jgi:pantetheine-phosphate adenylyltransferase